MNVLRHAANVEQELFRHIFTNCICYFTVFFSEKEAKVDYFVYPSIGKVTPFYPSIEQVTPFYI